MVPLELITLLGSTLVGGALKLWSMKIKAEQTKNDALMAAFTKTAEERQLIRENKEKGFTWTRRLIALSIVFSIFVLPKIAVLIWPDVGVTYGWTEWNPGFWFFTDGKEELLWHTITAGNIVLTPLDTHAAAAVMGLYFGGSIVGHK